MNAHDGTAHPHPDFDGVGYRRDPPEQRPHERAVTLSTDPEVVVIGDRDEIKSPFLGENRQVDEQAGGPFPPMKE